MPRKVNLGAKGEVEFPILDAGVFEDCEDEVRRLIAYSRNPERDMIPLGKDMAAVVSIVHRALAGTMQGLERGDVQKAITALSFDNFLGAIAEGLGFVRADSAGEAKSPPTST